MEFLKEVAPKKKVNPSDVIYLHGGGGFNSIYNWSPIVLRTLRNLFPKNLIIVGPSTVEREERYLKQILPKDKNIIFFARELVTYKFMKRFFSRVHLDEDTALQLSKDCDEFKKFCMNIPVKNNHKLLVLRKDIEAVYLPRAVSRKDYDIVCDPAYLKREDWLKVHLWASKITTNRCHSAILGAILGKEVNLYANSYHKNHSLWEFSLTKLDVNWVEHKFFGNLIVKGSSHLNKFCSYFNQELLFRGVVVNPIFRFIKFSRIVVSKL